MTLKFGIFKKIEDEITFLSNKKILPNLVISFQEMIDPNQYAGFPGEFQFPSKPKICKKRLPLDPQRGSVLDVVLRSLIIPHGFRDPLQLV